MQLIKDKLSSAAKEVLAQMFCHGPIWDGHLVSKSGRDELMLHGLIVKNHQGFQWLNTNGVYVAFDLKDEAKDWTDKRFYNKLVCK